MKTSIHQHGEPEYCTRSVTSSQWSSSCSIRDKPPSNFRVLLKAKDAGSRIQHMVKSSANQRKEHNVEKYIQWVTTLSPIRRYDTIGEFNVDSKAEFIFIILAVVASQIREIAQNSLKIRTCSSSMSSKVIDLGVNRKRTCNFLLVILTLDVWSYDLFLDIGPFFSSIARFPPPLPCLTPSSEETSCDITIIHCTSLKTKYI